MEDSQNGLPSISGGKDPVEGGVRATDDGGRALPTGSGRRYGCSVRSVREEMAIGSMTGHMRT